jgi:hypothetical protein
MLMDTLAKSSRTSRIAFSAAIIGIMVIAVYNWMVSPYVQCLHASQQLEIVIGDKARKNKILKANGQVRKKEVEKLRAELAGARAGLFTPDTANRFFSDIEVICYESGCVARSMTFLGNVDKLAVALGDSKVVAANSAAVGVAGSYGDIINFLGELTGRTQKVLVRSLKIMSSNSENNLLECELMITVYVVHDEESFTNE